MVSFTADFEPVADFLVAEDILNLLSPLSRLLANFECEFQGFGQFPEIPQHLSQTAIMYSELYQTNLLRQAALILPEARLCTLAFVNAFDDETDRRQLTLLCIDHHKLRRQAYSQPEHEQKLQRLMAQAVTLSDEMECKTSHGMLAPPLSYGGDWQLARSKRREALGGVVTKTA